MFHLRQIFLAFTKRERAAFLSATAAAILSGMVLVGFGFIQSTEAVPTSGGEYIEGFLGQPVYVNPVLASSEIDKGLVRLIFSNINDVAEKIEVSEDGRIWKVRLPENLLWQDGEKLTSDDIIFTIQSIQDPESSSPMLQVWRGIATQRLSELELQLSLVNPYAFFKDTLKSLYILPRHLFADVPPANWRLSDYNLRPVGSGPYKFISFEKRPNGFIELYKLAAWEEYSGAKPLIETLSFKLSSQVEDIIQNFNSGQVNSVAGLEPKDLDLVERPYETFSFHLPSYYAVFLNQSKSLLLKEIDVRKALNIAVDRESLIKKALDGHGRLARGPVPQETKYFNGELEVATTSTGNASNTLEQAGWKMNQDGFREKTIKKTKISLELDLAVPRIDFLMKTAEFLKGAWEEVGFKINVRVLSPEEISENAIKNRDYEMLIFGNVLNRSADLFSFWHSSERFFPGLNLALYNNKKADALIESIRQNLDSKSRTEQFNDLQALIINDQSTVFLYSPDYLYITSKNLRGVEAGLIAEPADRLRSAPSWYLKTARVLK